MMMMIRYQSRQLPSEHLSFDGSSVSPFCKNDQGSRINAFSDANRPNTLAKSKPAIRIGSMKF